MTTETWRLPSEQARANLEESLPYRMPSNHTRWDGLDVTLDDPPEQVRKLLRRTGAQLIAPGDG